MRILGIDPGLDGGLALLTDDGLLLEVMPTLGGKQREVDGGTVADLLNSWEPDFVAIEKVSSRPGQGVRSMFTFGMGVGIIKGVVAALGLPLTEVQPKEWQGAVCKGHAWASDPKATALLRARQLWPKISFLATERSKVPHSGLVDAACIAEYGRLRQMGVTR